MKLIRLRPWSLHHYCIAWFNIKFSTKFCIILLTVLLNLNFINGLQKYSKLADGNIAFQEAIENSLLTVHDISTENVGALCLEKLFRPLEIPLNSERYDNARQKVDLAHTVMQEVGVNRHGGLMDALAKGLLTDEHVKSARILAINITNGIVSSYSWWKRNEKPSTSTTTRNGIEEPLKHEEEGIEMGKKPDTSYPWFEDEISSPGLRSPKFAPAPTSSAFKGWWTYPYYSCSDRKWILSYSVAVPPLGRHYLRGFISIDIDITNLRVNQCELPILQQKLYQNIRKAGKFYFDIDFVDAPNEIFNQDVQAFHGSHKCHRNSMMCEYRNPIFYHSQDNIAKKLLPASIAQSTGQITTLSSILITTSPLSLNNGWSRGAYQCICREGYYSERFPTGINGTIMEVAYQEYQDNISLFYMEQFKCLPCSPGCGHCLSPAPCLASYNWPFRISILIISVCCAISTILLAGYMFHHRKKKIFKVASPIFLSITLIGCAIMYMEMAAIFPILDTYWCIATKWTRHMGFCITYTSLLMKTWRVSLTYRVKSAHKVKLTDKQLLQWMVPILLVMLIYLGTWTLSAAPNAEIIRDQDGLKFKQCSYNWWDHSLAIGEVFFLAWGIRVCYNVRNAESLYNEARQISYAIYNIALVNITMVAFHLLIFPQAGPDIKYLLGFIRTQLSTSVTIALVFGPKVLRVLRGQGDQWDNKAKVRSITASFSLNGVGLVPEESPDLYQENEELKEEIQKLAHQIEFMKTVHMQMNNRHLKPKPGSYFTITSTSFQTPFSSTVAAAAANANQQGNKGISSTQTQTSKTSQPNSCISEDGHSGSNSLGANSIGYPTGGSIPMQNNGCTEKV